MKILLGEIDEIKLDEDNLAYLNEIIKKNLY